MSPLKWRPGVTSFSIRNPVLNAFRQSRLDLLLGITAVVWLGLPISIKANAALETGAVEVPGAAADPVPLQVGQAFIPSQLQFTGQKTDYVFQASKGHSYLIQVDQNGLDFIVSVQAPDGVRLSYNSPLERDERELIFLEDAKPGDYLISLISEEVTDAGGNHSVRLAELEPASSNAAYIEALRLMNKGAAAYADDEWARKEEALTAYEAAIPFWEKSGRERGYAQALYTSAYLKYWVSYDNAGSIREAAIAARIYLDLLGEQTLYANSQLLSAGAMLEDLEFDEALAQAEEALFRHQELGNQYDAARAEELIGYAYHRKGELPVSVEYRRQAADRFIEIGEWFKALTPRARVAILEADRGYTSSAIVALEDIKNRLPPGADPFFRAELLDGLGDAYRLNGRVNEALTNYDMALEQHRNNSDVHGEASALRGIGKTYLISGHLELAAGFLRDAAATAEGSNIQIQEQALTALGSIDYLKGNYENSLNLHLQALALLRISEPDEPGPALTMSKVDLANRLVSIGRDLTALDRYEEARTYLAEAKGLLDGVDAPFHFAAVDHELGRAFLGDSEFEQAVRVLQSAQTGYESIGSQEGQAAVLYELARAHRQLEAYELAARFGENAIDHIESIRANIAKPELRAMFSESRRRYYEAQVDLLLQLHLDNQASELDFLARALTVSERSRARMTMDLIAEASIDIQRGVNPELRSHQQELRDELASRVYLQESPGGASRQMLNEIAEIEHSLTLLENEIRAENPLYVGFSTPKTLKAAEFQPLLEPDTVLLQYSLGAERSFAWVVTPDSIRGVELAGSGPIELAVKTLISALRTYPTDSDELNQARSSLSKYVLEPVRELIEGTRLIVVADGGLHYIPFAVLPLSASEPEKLLVMTHEIVNLPSMSVLSTLRNARRSRPPARKTIAVLADPVFSQSDVRLSRSVTEQPIPKAEFDDSAGRLAKSRYLEEMGLDRLQNTEYEARVIEDLVPAGQRLIARGFAANRESVSGEALNQYRYLHFATHGKVNTQFPGLSKLFLSNFDENGRYQSGTLLLDDIYNLDLNADLVVLSACDTALGQEIRGEGLVGFTQGFLYAGARSLIVSLWQVPDRATAELMSRFYQYILDEESSLRPAQALQKAQSSMASERRWRDPYLWGAFVLLGDWR